MSKIVLGLVGEKGAGKGTVSGFLANNYQARHFGTSAILRQTIHNLQLPLSRDNFIKLALVLKEGFGPTVIIDALIQQIEDSGAAGIIIADGIRMLEDIKPFQEKYGSDFYLIYVSADIKIRYERSKLRKEKAGEGQMSFEEFLAEERRLTELSIHEVGQRADFILNNDQNTAELEKQIKEMMIKIKGK